MKRSLQSSRESQQDGLQSRCGRQGKTFYANLLKLYITRKGSKPTGGAHGVIMVAPVAIIEPADENGVVDDKELLDLLNVRQRETYKTSTLVRI